MAAQGQLGLGATYFASGGNNDYPAAAFFKQGYLRYHFGTPQKSLRLGRFVFFEGQEMQQKNPSLAWLQTNRIAQRLIGRPANGHTALASVADISAAWKASKSLAVTLYYAYTKDKTVVASIYPSDQNMQFGSVELVYHWGIPQRAVNQ